MNSKMSQNQLSNFLIDQSKNLIWMLTSNFKLIYANKTYLNHAKEINRGEIKLSEYALMEATLLSIIRDTKEG